MQHKRSINISLLILISVFSLTLFIIDPVFAAQNYPLTSPYNFSSTSITDMALKIIGVAIRLIVGISGAVALLMFFYGGFTWITSAGDTAKVTKGKQVLIWASVGLMIVIFSFTIVDLTIFALTGKYATAPAVSALPVVPPPAETPPTPPPAPGATEIDICNVTQCQAVYPASTISGANCYVMPNPTDQTICFNAPKNGLSITADDCSDQGQTTKCCCERAATPPPASTDTCATTPNDACVNLATCDSASTRPKQIGGSELCQRSAGGGGSWSCCAPPDTYLSNCNDTTACGKPSYETIKADCIAEGPAGNTIQNCSTFCSGVGTTLWMFEKTTCGQLSDPKLQHCCCCVNF